MKTYVLLVLNIKIIKNISTNVVCWKLLLMISGYLLATVQNDWRPISRSVLIKRTREEERKKKTEKMIKKKKFGKQNQYT